MYIHCRGAVRAFQAWLLLLSAKFFCDVFCKQTNRVIMVTAMRRQSISKGASDQLDVTVATAVYCTGWPKKLYIFQHALSLEPFKIIGNGFHQNVLRISGNKD